ncbi:TetR/AcrR family transcriptional regulator C-terminal domain-containing protein [Bacillus chungangensis]|uniref:AcrR family transcriptional regulator n=1 Tax=Bacillus chungangensis TaxID=587633 RepID=A0ABT9WWV3_9BACI|nr:TetR/AcrR family transcriptional regulator C-terminal domain-containing protein [Bacillus chungangensis]MDQ0177772.1 AcrR family transcriptional regulator [Bacillus chungangensis]
MKDSSKKSLNHDLIIKAALDILDVHGPSGLSMRRLAASLNVEAASLYYHLPNKGILLQKIVDFSAVQAVLPEMPMKSWPTALRRLAANFRATLRKHPGVVPLIAIQPVSDEVAFQLSAPILAAMKEMNIEQEKALFVIQSISVFVIGHALAEVGNLPDPPTAPQAYYDEWFEMGLNALISGFQLQFDS